MKRKILKYIVGIVTLVVIMLAVANKFYQKLGLSQYVHNETEGMEEGRSVWDPKNEESFNDGTSTSTTILMVDYNIEKVEVIGKEFPDELQDVRYLGGANVERKDGTITSSHSIIKVTYTVESHSGDYDFLGNVISIKNDSIDQKHKRTAVKMIPYKNDVISAQHFHYPLTQNDKTEFMNYYVVEDSYIASDNLNSTYVYINPSGQNEESKKDSPNYNPLLFKRVYFSNFLDH